MKESFNEVDSNLERDVGHHTDSINDSSLSLSFLSYLLLVFPSVFLSSFFF